MNPRVRALHDLSVADAREVIGLHDYDGVVQDLSPAGVATGLERLGAGPRETNPHDEAHLAAAEVGARTWYRDLEMHRWNPLVHIGNLDLACYDREYAPAEERAEARRRHLAGWPDGVDAAIEALDRVPAPVAAALLPGARGLGAGLEEESGDAEAVSAHRRPMAHLERAVVSGPPEAALGADALARAMGDGEAMTIDLGRLADRAEAERARLHHLLAEACARLQPGVPTREVVDSLVADHPGPDGIVPAAAALIDEATAFTVARRLLPDLGGECRVGPAPESRRWAMAMMSWAAPYEDDGPSWYHVTPPDPSWPAEDQEEWLAVFSHTTLPAITVHEVTPGHYAHGRFLRQVEGDVRRGLMSVAFIEGWAHYAEQLLLEEGFRADDPRYAVGVGIEALVRVTRLEVALGLHSGAFGIEEGTRRFEEAFLRGPAARSEATRATYDPTYGRYTWGKLEILALRDEAVARWGERYSHLRFHQALLELGAPPLGLIDAALG
jgi:hypothetical protein